MQVVGAPIGTRCRKLFSTAADPDRCNYVGIQMLSKRLRDQLFGQETPITPDIKKRIKTHLKDQKLWDKPKTCMPDIDFQLPPMLGIVSKSRSYPPFLSAIHVEQWAVEK